MFHINYRNAGKSGGPMHKFYAGVRCGDNTASDRMTLTGGSVNDLP